MKKLERMKNSLCQQIQSMGVEQMGELTDLLEEWDDHGISLFDLNELFICEVCEEFFGKCTDGVKVCSGRFQLYAEIEGKKLYEGL